MVDLSNWVILGLSTLPLWGMLLWSAWRLGIQPRLLPGDQIAALADDLIARHGRRAEDMAFAEEDRAWRYSQSGEQGKWHRVRRELWRRYESGEWAGPAD